MQTHSKKTRDFGDFVEKNVDTPEDPIVKKNNPDQS